MRGEGCDRYVLTEEEAAEVRYVIRDWLPGQAQYLLDGANATIKTDPDWMEEDEYAGQCQRLAAAARIEARLGQALDLAARHRSGEPCSCDCCRERAAHNHQSESIDGS